MKPPPIQDSIMATTAKPHPKPASKNRRPAKAPQAAVAIMAPPPPPQQGVGKIGLLIALLQRPGGATLEEMTVATGWQAHSVRGAMSGALKKKRGLALSSQKLEGRRTYAITDGRKII